jgi:hypothetical protein
MRVLSEPARSRHRPVGSERTPAPPSHGEALITGCVYQRITEEVAHQPEPGKHVTFRAETRSTRPIGRPVRARPVHSDMRRQGPGGPQSRRSRATAAWSRTRWRKAMVASLTALTSSGSSSSKSCGRHGSARGCSRGASSRVGRGTLQRHVSGGGVRRDGPADGQGPVPEGDCSYLARGRRALTRSQRQVDERQHPCSSVTVGQVISQ